MLEWFNKHSATHNSKDPTGVTISQSDLCKLMKACLDKKDS